MTNALRTAAKSKSGRVAGFLFSLAVAVLAGSMLGTGSSGNGCPPAMTYGQHFVCYAGSDPPKVINFQGLAGEKVLFRMRDTNPNPAQGQLAVKNPSGSYLCVSSTVTEVEMECTLTEGGIHQMLVVPPANTQIFYSVYLARFSPSPSETIHNIAYGDVLSGSVAPMRWHPWQFEGADQEKVLLRVRAKSGDLDPEWSIRRPNGTELCSGSAWQGGEGDTECTLNVAGTNTYTIWMRSNRGNQSGEFDIYLARLSNPKTGPPTSITYGSITAGAVAPMRWRPYTFQGAHNERILIRVRETSGEYDARWTVRRPDGSELCYGGTAPGPEAHRECVLNVPGTNNEYTIWMRAGQGNESGEFNLYLARLSEPETEMPTAIAYGDVLAGSVVPMRWYPYTFNATSGERVLIRVRETGGDYHAVWTVRRPDGSQLCDDSTALFGEEYVECLPNVSGTQQYTIWMRAGDGNEGGDFQMYLARLSEPTTETGFLIDYEEHHDGLIAPMRWYPITFVGNNNETVAIQIGETDAGLNLRMSLRSPSGIEVCSAGDTVVIHEICTLAQAGIQTIWIYSAAGGDYGGFDLIVSVPGSSWESIGGEYSHGAGCSPGKRIDPITTILISGESSLGDARQETEDVLSQAGLNNGANPFIDRQYYLDEDDCVEGEITQATDDQYCVYPAIPCAEEQWHIRCNVLHQESPFGRWSSCTPHWDEETDAEICAQFHHSHYVPPEWAGHGNEGSWGYWEGSGFDAARDWLYWQLVVEDGMTFVGIVDFDNVQPMQQCNGERTQADGKVNIIHIGD